MHRGDVNCEVTIDETMSQRFLRQGCECRGRPGSCHVGVFGVQGIRFGVTPNRHERIQREESGGLGPAAIGRAAGDWLWWAEGGVFAGVLAEKAEEDASQCRMESMLVCEDLEVRLEGQQMGRTGGMGAAEEVMVGFCCTALRWAVGVTRLVESKLLYLEWKDFVNPFGESFLLCKREEEERRLDDVPVYCIK